MTAGIAMKEELAEDAGAHRRGPSIFEWFVWDRAEVSKHRQEKSPDVSKFLASSPISPHSLLHMLIFMFTLTDSDL